MSPPMHGAELLDRIPKIRSIREEISQVIWEQNSHINRARLLVNQFKAEIGYHCRIMIFDGKSFYGRQIPICRLSLTQND